MRGGNGILGVSAKNFQETSIIKTRKQWLKRKEKWLVVLGIILHAVYMLSIFDIYFKTPIVHGMDPVTPRFTAPAKRLVLLVADGLRADKFFEPDSDGNYRAPYLRSVIKERGRWGVSHARPPTESRPGHVAIIAGFYEDPSAVTKDASFLDEWSFDQFQNLLNRSNEDASLKQLLHQDNLVIFLHLLGCDSNGHAHWPYSSIYLNNVKVVDRIAERVYDLIQSYFKDNLTAYVFTADHGMSDKGSHGDGHPSNTDTPLVAWGAGVRYPVPVSHIHHCENTVLFVDKHMHDMPTPPEWGLDGIERVDVNQADIAPLMSTLLGLPCPVNSVGNLPLGYVSFSEVDEVEAVLANTRQILSQFLRKSQLKESSSLHFKPFKPLANYSMILDQIEYLISVKDYEAAKNLSEKLRSLALEGLHYFQTYDWLMLMTVISLGYVGWMIYLILHVLHSYTSLTGKILGNDLVVNLRKNAGKVKSFMERKLYTWCFLFVGVTASIYLFYLIPWRSGVPIFVWLACWFLSVFTLMPAEIPDNTQLVVASGFFIIVIGGVARYLNKHAGDSRYWLSLTRDMKKPKFPMLFQLQILLVGFSSLMVSLSTSHRTEKQELLVLHQVINWLIAGFSMVLPLFSAVGLLSRLTSIFLGFAPAFLLLSIGYEAVFYSALALALLAWILFENAILCTSKVNRSSTSINAMEDNIIVAHEDRHLQLSDMRIPLAFMVFFNIAFFGTGNFASIASFEISSVYRFITIFSPFLMAALLIFKLLIPFILVICAFSAITKLIQVPLLGCYFLVICCSDVMTIHFFYLVQNTGSWMEIGNSISHFGIMSAQVVFVLLLFALTNVYTKDIQPRSRKQFSRKAM
ncbi:sulfuric ester hydrolase [Forsythia ovata]|uniref:GPI ethanolamine phosphate transferase 1 n=1 Tax=Forsythia ovata TaxID=205694 RepID=A0ABD1UUZ2_9LAMI